MPEEAWVGLAEPAFRTPVESWEWRAERAYRAWAREAPGERAAPAAAARAWKIGACIRSDPAERAAEQALPDEPARKPVVLPAR